MVGIVYVGVIYCFLGISLGESRLVAPLLGSLVLLQTSGCCPRWRVFYPPAPLEVLHVTHPVGIVHGGVLYVRQHVLF